LAGKENPKEITMNGDKTVAAVFAEERILKIPEVFLSPGTIYADSSYITVSPAPTQQREKYQYAGYNILRYVYADNQQVEIIMRGMNNNYIYQAKVVPCSADATIDDNIWSDNNAGDTHYMNGTTKSFVLTLDKNYALHNFERVGKLPGALAVVSNGTIAIDGDTSDWNNASSYIYEKGIDDIRQEPDSEYVPTQGLVTDVKSIKAVRDDNYIYVLWEMETGFNQDPLWGYFFDIRPVDGLFDSVRTHIWKHDSTNTGHLDVNGDGYNMAIVYNAKEAGQGQHDDSDNDGHVNGKIFEARLSINFVEEKLGSTRLQDSNYYVISGEISRKESIAGPWHGGGGRTAGILIEKF
jgi:hypothetical protein